MRAAGPGGPDETDAEALRREVNGRRAALDAVLSERGIDAAVFATEPNFRYLTGYDTPSWVMTSRPIMLLVRPGGTPEVIVSSAEADAIRTQAVDVDVAPYVDPELDVAGELQFGTPAAKCLVAAIASAPASRIGLELGSHFAPSLSPVAAALLRASFSPEDVVDVSPLIWGLRRRKSRFEVDRMTEAADVLSHAYGLFEEQARAGMTEQELFALLWRSVASSGGSHGAYLAVRCGLDNPLLGPPTNRVWAHDQLMYVDAAIEVNGYWTDYCRIYAAESPSPVVRSAYTQLTTALGAARSAARVGTPVAELATTVATSLNLGAETSFGRFGHGIGMEPGEPPSLHPNEPWSLEEGTVVCLEPSQSFEFGSLVAEEEVAVFEDQVVSVSPAFPAEIPILG